MTENSQAGVAELVDAPDSKSGTGNSVRVQVSLPAPLSVRTLISIKKYGVTVVCYATCVAINFVQCPSVQNDYFS